MMELLTQRLVLKPFRREDINDLHAYARKASVGPPAGWKPHRSPEESRRVLERFLNQDIWAIRLKGVPRVIGSVGLHQDTRREGIPCRMAGYVLDDPYWGRGIVPEALRAVMYYGFSRMGLEIISAYHFPENAASRKVLEKCGFSQEGMLRRSMLTWDGRIADLSCWSITREEYWRLSSRPGRSAQGSSSIVI